MTCGSKGFCFLFFIALMVGIDDRSYAMDRSAQKGLEQGASRNGESWPWFIDSNLGSKQFFVIKSIPYSPRNLHMKGISCTGHEGNPLYEPINAYIPALIEAADYANTQHDIGSAWHYLRCSRFFEAYLDATCSHIARGDVTHNEKIDALESMIKIFPKIDSASSTQWHCSAAYQNAVGMLDTLAHHDNARAQSVLANLYASMAGAGPEYRSAVGLLMHALFDSKTESECREIMLTYDLRAAFSVCDFEHDSKLKSLFQGFLYERGTAEEKSKAYEYFKKVADSDLLAECYYAHAQLAGIENAPSLADVFGHLERLMASDVGRQILPIFAELCDEKTIQLLSNKKNNKFADKILGLVSYIKEQDKRAFTCLKLGADKQAQPYIYYCLACLYKDGRGTPKNYDKAVELYVKAIKAGADGALKNDIALGLNDIAEHSHLAANCEFLLMVLDNQESYKTVLKVVDAYWNKEQLEREAFINYLLDFDRYQYIEQVAKQGNVGAQYLLGALLALKSDVVTDPLSTFCQGVAYLMHSKNEILDVRALECFLQSLWRLDMSSLNKQFLNFAMPGTDTVVAQITRRIQQGDPRFIVVLLRLALVFGLESVGIDQRAALAYLNTAIEHNIPGIDSLAAYLYRNGIWVEKSEERAFLCCQKVLNKTDGSPVLLDNALNELLALAAADSRIGIMARYGAVVHLVKRGPRELNCAMKLFRQAEMLVREVVQDKGLHEFARTSGAWEAMLLMTKNDDGMAAFMGALYAARLKCEADDETYLNEIETVGMQLLEKVRGKTDSIDDAFVSKIYAGLADALYKHGADSKRCMALLERAITLAPDNAGALHRLSIYYKDAAQLKCANAKSYASKCYQLLLASAKLKNPIALMDLAVAYMPDAGSMFVTLGIIKPSETTALGYLREILGEDPLQNVECIKKDIHGQRSQVLALILLAKMHIVKDLPYTARLMPHILWLFTGYQEVVAQSGRPIDDFDRVMLREGHYLMGLWSIMQKQWDNAISSMKKFDVIAGPSFESAIQQAMCHMKKSALLIDSDLKNKCYHDAMVCMLEVIKLGVIEHGVFVNDQVGTLFAQILDELNGMKLGNRYVHNILTILTKSLVGSGFCSIR